MFFKRSTPVIEKIPESKIPEPIPVFRDPFLVRKLEEILSSQIVEVGNPFQNARAQRESRLMAPTH